MNHLLSTTALLRQLMRVYTLSTLTNLTGPRSDHVVVEKEIIDWVNNKLSEGNKTTWIGSFQVIVVFSF